MIALLPGSPPVLTLFSSPFCAGGSRYPYTSTHGITDPTDPRLICCLHTCFYLPYRLRASESGAILDNGSPLGSRTRRTIIGPPAKLRQEKCQEVSIACVQVTLQLDERVPNYLRRAVGQPGEYDLSGRLPDRTFFLPMRLFSGRLTGKCDKPVRNVWVYSANLAITLPISSLLFKIFLEQHARGPMDRRYGRAQRTSYPRSQTSDRV